MQDVTDAAQASTGVAMRWSMQQARRAVLVFVAAVCAAGECYGTAAVHHDASL